VGTLLRLRENILGLGGGDLRKVYWDLGGLRKMCWDLGGLKESLLGLGGT